MKGYGKKNAASNLRSQVRVKVPEEQLNLRQKGQDQDEEGVWSP